MGCLFSKKDIQITIQQIKLTVATLENKYIKK